MREAETGYGHEQGFRVFLVDGDAEDTFRARKDLETSGYVEKVRCFPNGKALLDYMRGEGFYDRSVLCLTPILIILASPDPGDDEASGVLANLKSDPFLQDIPVLVAETAAGRAPRGLRPDGVLPRPFTAGPLMRHARKAWRWPTREMWMN